MKQTILSNKLNTLSKFFDLEQISQKSVTTEKISNYYKLNRLAYYIFNSTKGYVHMGISRNGKFKKSDFEEPLVEIAQLIKEKNATSVLELAAGKGANSYFLSQKFPNVQFNGLDLPVGQTQTAFSRSAKTKNFKMFAGDYHKLEMFADASFDIVFVIEALCHSDNKDIVAKEVNRVLRPKGLFFVADGYLGRSENLLPEELLTKKLVEKGMMVNNLQEYERVKRMIMSEGFTLDKEEDVSKFVIPTVKRFEKLARFFFNLGPVARLLLRILPKDFSHNIVSGYLLPDVLELGFGVYYFSVFKKI